MCLFIHGCNIILMDTHLSHPTGWSVDYWRLLAPGWKRSDVQIVARLYPQHLWCELAEEWEATGAEKQTKAQTQRLDFHNWNPMNKTMNLKSTLDFVFQVILSQKKWSSKHTWIQSNQTQGMTKHLNVRVVFFLCFHSLTLHCLF